MVSELTAQVAQIVPYTEAEGPGKRFAVWFQGCPLRCPGCCNPEFLSFKGGESKSLADMLALLGSVRVEGVSLLGGEPFAHAAEAAAFAAAARQRSLSVMVYSGYTIEAIRALPDPAAAELLALTDVLVDGPYVREQPEPLRRWVGSANQRVHLLTDRYRADDPCWTRPNTLEIRVHGPTVTVNGFPAAGPAVGLWKGWTRKPRPSPSPVPDGPAPR